MCKFEQKTKYNIEEIHNVQLVKTQLHRYLSVKKKNHIMPYYD